MERRGGKGIIIFSFFFPLWSESQVFMVNSTAFSTDNSGWGGRVCRKKYHSGLGQPQGSEKNGRARDMT